jgi:superfamily II DNA/RNA helicase
MTNNETMTMTNMTTTIPCCHHRDKIQALIVHRRELAMQIHAEAAETARERLPVVAQ